MNLVISMETWDIDDTLMLLFLLHYHLKGKINIIAVEIDRGTLLQNNYVNYILRRVEVEIPLFSRNIPEDSGEIPDYYYDFFENLERKELRLRSREELVDLLRGRKFKLLVGGSLNLIPFLLKEGIYPEEIFIQGGFAGRNITGETHKKFGNRVFNATFNFNKDIKATEEFFRLKEKVNIPTYLISKNVNHLILVRYEEVLNIATETKPQEFYLDILRKYLKVCRREKSLHDVYAAVAMFKRDLFLWKEVKPVFREGKKFREWGAVEAKSNIWITVKAKDEEIKKYVLFRKEF